MTEFIELAVPKINLPIEYADSIYFTPTFHGFSILIPQEVDGFVSVGYVEEDEWCNLGDFFELGYNCSTVIEAGCQLHYVEIDKEFFIAGYEIGVIYPDIIFVIATPQMFFSAIDYIDEIG